MRWSEEIYETNVLLKKLGVAGAMFGMLATVANATVVYNTTVTSGAVSGSASVIGMDFAVNNFGGNVTAMGVFDDGLNGFQAPVQVAIYRASDGSMVAGTAVTFAPGSSGSLVGSTAFKNISPVFLSPGTYSVVVANLGTTLDKAYYYNGGVSAATFNNLGGELSLVSKWRLASGTTLPAMLPSPSITGPVGVPAWGAGSFDFTPVPEAADFAMAGMGLLAVVYVGRCAVLRRKFAA